MKTPEIKQSMLARMFPADGSTTPQIRFQGFSEPWQEVKLGEIGEFRSNGVDKKSSPDETPINLLNYMDVYNKRHITAANCKELMQVTATERQLQMCDVRSGDVFFTPSSETPGDIGHALVIEETLPSTCYSYHLIRFRPNPDRLYLTFPNYSFESEYVRKQLIRGAQGVQRYVLSRERFENLSILLPTLAEQRLIGTYFRSLDTAIRQSELRAEALRRVRASMLARMFPNNQ